MATVGFQPAEKDHVYLCIFKGQSYQADGTDLSLSVTTTNFRTNITALQHRAAVALANNMLRQVLPVKNRPSY
jgi:hypothetical protein